MPDLHLHSRVQASQCCAVVQSACSGAWHRWPTGRLAAQCIVAKYCVFLKSVQLHCSGVHI